MVTHFWLEYRFSKSKQALVQTSLRAEREKRAVGAFAESRDCPEKLVAVWPMN